MTRLKREQVEKQAAREAQAQMKESRLAGLSPAARRDALARAKTKKTLAILMAEDSTVAQLYQESYKAAKADAEQEMDELKELHDRFDYYLDEERMADKLPTEWYDVKAVEEAEHVQYSTDFTDQAEDMVYKRYKMQ